LCRFAGAGLLALAVSACGGGAPPATFDLSAPTERVRTSRIPGNLLVTPPAAVQVLASDRILVRDGAGGVSYLPGAQWADQLPALVQARMIQAFENAARLGRVSRPGDRVKVDYQLNTELRAFEIQAARGEAVVEISAKAVSEATGRVAHARIFTARVPVSAIDPAGASRALDQALGTVLVEIVRWAGTGAGEVPAASVAPPA
jgi:cholesterol transport system auxiliary component